MITKSIQAILWLVPAVLLLVVFGVRADLDGDYHVRWEPGDTSAFIHGLRPTGRVEMVEENGDMLARLSGDPVYLSVTPPGDYETALVEMELSSNGQPLVELGATVNAEAGQIDLRPVLNTIIGDLAWSEVTSDDIRLLQRDKRFASVEAFLRNPPALSEIATYQMDMPEPEQLPRSWFTGSDAVLTSASLRGFHRFVTATEGERLALEVTYMDMNRAPGADPVEVRVFQDGELVASRLVEDDGVETETNASLGRQSFQIEASGLQEGLVQVELLGSNDIYWRELRSSLPKMTFLSNVFVGDDVGYLPETRSVELYTDAQHLTLFTRHAEAVGEVLVGGEVVNVEVPHEHYHVEIEELGLSRIVLPNADMLLVTDGRLAFSQEAFFNPYPVRMDDRTNVDRLGVNYVLTTYAPEGTDDGWTRATATYGLGPLEREPELPSSIGMGGSYRFVLSLPRVEEREAHVDVRSIDIYFTRPRRSFGDVARKLFNTLGL